MITSLNEEELINYTSRQLNYFFPDNNTVSLFNYRSAIQLALQKIENCYKLVTLKHYNDNGQAKFNHLYSDHYVMYLWYIANEIWTNSHDVNVCNKLYYLNKSLHSFDCMFDTNLPDIFLVFHGAGTMLGKAKYDDYFVVLQGCTIGMNKGHYPKMNKGVALTANSSLIGNCEVGKCVTISSYTNVIDKNIENNSVVFRNDDGKLVQKPSTNPYAQTFFNIPI